MSCLRRVISQPRVDDTSEFQSCRCGRLPKTLVSTNSVKTCQKFSGAPLQLRDMVANMSEVPALLPSLTERLTTSWSEEPHPRSRLSSASSVAVVAATLGALCGFAVFGAKSDAPRPAARATVLRAAVVRTAPTD